MTLSLDTAYRSFGGEVEASSTPTICRLPDSRRHQLWAIAPERGRSAKKRHSIEHIGEPSGAMSGPAISAAMCEERSGQMQSWYQDLLEDRLTHCGHSLDAVFRSTADRSNLLVALKRSTRIVDRLETARS